MGLEDCAGARGGTSGIYYSRPWSIASGGGVAGADTRVWTPIAVSSSSAASSSSNGRDGSRAQQQHQQQQQQQQQYQLYSNATGRCLFVVPQAPPASGSGNRVVLLPCNSSQPAGLWRFDVGVSTVSSISSALTGQALAVSNATLYSTGHGSDAFPVSDNAFGARQ